jgi:quercetin dioxygenase-like cupin family protein
MKRMLIITLLTLATSSLALGHMENQQVGSRSTAERQEGQAEHQRREDSPQSEGLILQADEGERMVRRWGLPMTIKVDPRNGGSQHLVVGTEDLPPGKAIPVHKHPHADEVVLLLRGTGVATLGEQRREVTPGALLFIPQGEWVGLENTGQETIRVVFIFSERGFDTYLRATSVPEGQEVTPLSPRELAEIRREFQPYITFKEE